MFNAESFSSLQQAQVLVEDHRRPAQLLGCWTPGAFIAAFLAATAAWVGFPPPSIAMNQVASPLVTTAR